MTQTSSHTALFAQIGEARLIPIIREDSPDDALWVGKTVLESGFQLAEVTWTVPDAAQVIRELQQARPDCAIGAGTILTVKDAQEAIEAGATFLVSPGWSQPLANWTKANRHPWIPGIATPTEVMQAVAFGLDTLKVFPAKALGGPAFLKALLKGPFPNLKLIPTGGVCLNHVQEYWDAGAFAVGCGSDLVPRQAVEQRNASLIRAQSANYLNLLRSGC